MDVSCLPFHRDLRSRALTLIAGFQDVAPMLFSVLSAGRDFKTHEMLQLRRKVLPALEALSIPATLPRGHCDSEADGRAADWSPAKVQATVLRAIQANRPFTPEECDGLAPSLDRTFRQRPPTEANDSCLYLHYDDVAHTGFGTPGPHTFVLEEPAILGGYNVVYGATPVQGRTTAPVVEEWRLSQRVTPPLVFRMGFNKSPVPYAAVAAFIMDFTVHGALRHVFADSQSSVGSLLLPQRSPLLYLNPPGPNVPQAGALQGAAEGTLGEVVRTGGEGGLDDKQLLYTLFAVAAFIVEGWERARFSHRDLHLDNILLRGRRRHCRPDDPQRVVFRIPACCNPRGGENSDGDAVCFDFLNYDIFMSDFGGSAITVSEAGSKPQRLQWDEWTEMYKTPWPEDERGDEFAYFLISVVTSLGPDLQELPISRRLLKDIFHAQPKLRSFWQLHVDRDDSEPPSPRTMAPLLDPTSKGRRCKVNRSDFDSDNHLSKVARRKMSRLCAKNFDPCQFVRTVHSLYGRVFENADIQRVFLRPG